MYDSRVGSTSSGGTNSNQDDEALAVNLAAGYQLPLNNNFGLRLDYGGYSDFHKDYKEYDVIDQTISFEPQYSQGQKIYSLPVAFNYVMEDNKTDYIRYTVSPTLTYLIPQTDQAVAIYGNASLIDDKDNVTLDEDGSAIGGGCAYILFFQKNSRIRLSLDYQHTGYDANVIDYGTNSISQDNREDDSLTAGLDMLFQINSYFGLFSSYSYIHSSSNVETFDYGRHLVEAGLSFKI